MHQGLEERGGHSENILRTRCRLMQKSPVNLNKSYFSSSSFRSGILSELMFSISSTVEIPPADLRLDDVDEEVGTYTENVPESQPPSQSVPTNPRESHTADNSSFSNPPKHSHRPSRNDTAMRVEAVDNNNSATPNSQGEAPPPYIEAAGSRGD